ncbi:MAG: 1-deoxy-D-xylulose-5-phosphate synthase N-terminal domain-containing protein [Oscillospiraceae bacterium]
MNALPGGQQIYRVTHKLKQGLKDAILSCSMFEEMGFTYIGPVDGHDVAALTRLLQWIKTLEDAGAAPCAHGKRERVRLRRADAGRLPWRFPL